MLPNRPQFLSKLKISYIIAAEIGHGIQQVHPNVISMCSDLKVLVPTHHHSHTNMWAIPSITPNTKA